MAHPFHAPAEAPTIRSGLNRPLRLFHTPASQAANMPPAESTSAVATYFLNQNRGRGITSFTRAR